mgnify:CR=1 FL=1
MTDEEIDFLVAAFNDDSINNQLDAVIDIGNRNFDVNYRKGYKTKKPFYSYREILENIFRQRKTKKYIIQDLENNKCRIRCIEKNK